MPRLRVRSIFLMQQRPQSMCPTTKASWYVSAQLIIPAGNCLPESAMLSHCTAALRVRFCQPDGWLAGHLHHVSLGPAVQICVQDQYLPDSHCWLEHVAHRYSTLTGVAKQTGCPADNERMTNLSVCCLPYEYILASHPALASDLHVSNGLCWHTNGAGLPK